MSRAAELGTTAVDAVAAAEAPAAAGTGEADVAGTPGAGVVAAPGVAEATGVGDGLGGANLSWKITRTRKQRKIARKTRTSMDIRMGPRVSLTNGFRRKRVASRL